MPEINLPTAGKQDTILANTNAINSNVNSVNTNVNANKSTLATVNANLGTPTSGASNTTGSNAHAKLNYINSMLGTINSNVNAGNRHAGVYKVGPHALIGQSNVFVDVRGKGVLRKAWSSSQAITVTIDGVRIMENGSNHVFVDFPFNSSLQIHGSQSTTDNVDWIYELY